MLIYAAGAEFTEFILQAAFGDKKSKTVQAYVDLSAESGGDAIKKEIDSDIAYFSVNIQLGVSLLLQNQDSNVIQTQLTTGRRCRKDLADR